MRTVRVGDATPAGRPESPRRAGPVEPVRRGVGRWAGRPSVALSSPAPDRPAARSPPDRDPELIPTTSPTTWSRRQRVPDPQCSAQPAHPARGDPARAAAQLLHHRAHRPRQVDARRPHAPAHRRRRRPADARPVPRPHGHRARARHHDQVAGRADAVGAGRHPVRAQHDRHPGPRRLHLRGVPVAGGVRGRRPPGRRRPGHRGADARQPLPGDGERPHDRPGAQQDRPAGRAAREVRRGAGQARRLRAGGRPAGLRARPAPASPSCWTGSWRRSRGPAATRTPRPGR